MVDRQGWPIPVPRDPEVNRMEHLLLIFDVRQDRQPVQIPTQMEQDQDLSHDQMQQVRVMEVAAVPVVQEKPQARRRMQSLPRQSKQRAEQQPSRFVRPPPKRPYGPTPPGERERTDAVKRRVQQMANHQELAPCLVEHTYDLDMWSELAAQETNLFFDRLRRDNVQAREQPVTSTPALAMGSVGHGSRMVLPPWAQSQMHLQPPPFRMTKSFSRSSRVRQRRVWNKEKI